MCRKPIFDDSSSDKRCPRCSVSIEYFTMTKTLYQIDENLFVYEFHTFSTHSGKRQMLYFTNEISSTIIKEIMENDINFNSSKVFNIEELYDLSWSNNYEGSRISGLKISGFGGSWRELNTDFDF
jgi:hypothetical protein